MRTSGDPKATVEFTGQGIVHVSFKETGTLSTHMLREIVVESKVQYGESPKAIIFSLHDAVESDRFFSKISNRPQHILPGILISLVCLSKSTLAAAHAYLGENTAEYPVAVFTDYKQGLNWVEYKLRALETIKTLPVQNKPIGMIASC